MLRKYVAVVIIMRLDRIEDSRKSNFSNFSKMKSWMVNYYHIFTTQMKKYDLQINNHEKDFFLVLIFDIHVSINIDII